MPTTKSKRHDGQLTATSGELFVAAELLKRGVQIAVTFGNAKSIDLLAYNPTTEKQFAIQVKALYSKNPFLIGHNKIKKEHIYVFVMLNKPGEIVQYYVVPGKDLHADPARFGKSFTDEKMPGIHPKALAALGYENAWSIFGASVA